MSEYTAYGTIVSRCRTIPERATVHPTNSDVMKKRALESNTVPDRPFIRHEKASVEIIGRLDLSIVSLPLFCHAQPSLSRPRVLDVQHEAKKHD